MSFDRPVIDMEGAEAVAVFLVCVLVHVAADAINSGRIGVCWANAPLLLDSL